MTLAKAVAGNAKRRIRSDFCDMGLDITLAGRKIVDRDKGRRDDGFPVHAVELDFQRWFGWEYAVISERATGIGQPKDDGAIIWLDEDALPRLIDILISEEELPPSPSFSDTETLTKEERVQFASWLQYAFAWLTDRNQPACEERKVYLEVDC